MVAVFEGRDAAGKGGAIKRITECLNPRICRVVALSAPTERETTQWYFQRYVAHLPAAGEIVLFDRSWYNRAGVERVMGFCTEAEYMEFLHCCPQFERMLVRSGIQLVKYWFSVSDEEQERRFQDRLKDVTKRWKLSPMDIESRRHWVDYSQAKDEMFAHTDIKQAPWYVVNADNKKCARLNVISHLLSVIPYQDLTPEPIKLPPPTEESTYVRRLQTKHSRLKSTSRPRNRNGRPDFAAPLLTILTLPSSRTGCRLSRPARCECDQIQVARRAGHRWLRDRCRIFRSGYCRDKSARLSETLRSGSWTGRRSSNPRETAGTGDVCKLGVHAVKASELMCARYPQGALDGVDTDIIGDTREVFGGTLPDLFENDCGFGR